MKDTVQNGLDASGTIPGGLNLQRKAKFLSDNAISTKVPKRVKTGLCARSRTP